MAKREGGKKSAKGQQKEKGAAAKKPTKAAKTGKKKKAAPAASEAESAAVELDPAEAGDKELETNAPPAEPKGVELPLSEAETEEPDSETADGEGKAQGEGEQGEPADFRYIHSDNFPELLEAIAGTLFVTTYQAGKLVAFRSREGRLSMLLRTFDKAMGLAVSPERMAIATNHYVWFLRNSPEIAAKMQPAGTYDSCYLPRTAYVSGSLDFHEMAWGGDELWIINTLFSCICTLHTEHSFVPRWRPKFVSQLIRQDRCHLNGMAVVDGKPKYVTAFGETDTPEGWRPGKVDGGLLIDVPSGEILVRGLSMPHSPRVHMGKLWVLDSGNGHLCVVDTEKGTTETVAALPGYTRGLAFYGPFAFVGLSKIRETAVFGGVPIAENMDERKCGVSVVDLRSGNVVAFIEFEGTVEEVFDIQLLPRIRYPAVVGLQKKTIQRACVIGPETSI